MLFRSTYSMDYLWFGGEPVDVPDEAAIRDDAEQRARAQLDEVRDEVAVSAVPGISDVGAELLVVRGHAAHVLVHHTEGAELLVVGNRGRGAARSAMLGSVALHCSTHASCPVLVVHADPVAVADPRKVVVGVDGSDASRGALSAAVEEAAARGADLEVVATYQVTNYWSDLAGVVLPSVAQIRYELYNRTQDVVDSVLAGRPEDAPTPQVSIVVAEGPPGHVLVRHGQTADLLVVGFRGHGAFRGLLLGSVALHCVMHAPCPVLVVRPGASRVLTPRTSVRQPVAS